MSLNQTAMKAQKDSSKQTEYIQEVAANLPQKCLLLGN